MNLKEEPAAYSVSQFTEVLRKDLESKFDWVQIRGEISNFKKAPSGHVYFRLKDDDAVLECVAWRSTAVRWGGLELKDGKEVVAGGKITVYPPRGQYQLVVSAMRLAGLGALQQRFEALKRMLAEEGLFDSSRKKPLPRFPKKIAAITSPTGAAIRDFLKILHAARCPVDVTVCPVLVQGIEAAREIAAMIETVNRLRRFDVIVLCRGGGSLEDLWAFNEEIVARAIAGSSLPVISAVGHEIDFTIADFVADTRAPTPTAAGQLIAEIFERFRADLQWKADRLNRLVLPAIRNEKRRIEVLEQALRRYHPFSAVEQRRQRLDECVNFLLFSMKSHIETLKLRCRQSAQSIQTGCRYSIGRFRGDIERYHRLVHSFDPRKNLSRGYSICRHADGRLIARAAAVQREDRITITVSDGSFGATVHEVETDHGER